MRFAHALAHSTDTIIGLTHSNTLCVVEIYDYDEFACVQLSATHFLVTQIIIDCIHPLTNAPANIFQFTTFG